MDILRRIYSPTAESDAPGKPFRRKHFALPLLALLTLVAVAIDVFSGPYISFGAGYFLVVAIAAYAFGPVWGAIAAIAMLCAELAAHFAVSMRYPSQTAQVLSSQLNLTTLLNHAIIYSITVALFVVVHDVNRLREENLKLRTLRQTMVTVNDIVFNRLQYFTVLLDAIEGGVMPTPRQVEIGRNALREVTKKLRQLSALNEVNSYLAAGDIEAVLLEDEPSQRSA